MDRRKSSEVGTTVPFSHREHQPIPTKEREDLRFSSVYESIDKKKEILLEILGDHIEDVTIYRHMSNKSIVNEINKYQRMELLRRTEVKS